MTDNLVEYDIRLRQAGKTYDLIEWWRQSPSRVIVVPDSHQVGFLRKQLPDLDNREITRRIITFEDMRSGRVLRGRGDVEIGIDNLDMILQRLVSANGLLRRVTATGLLADATILALRDA